MGVPSYEDLYSTSRRRLCDNATSDLVPLKIVPEKLVAVVPESLLRWCLKGASWPASLGPQEADGCTPAIHEYLSCAFVREERKVQGGKEKTCLGLGFVIERVRIDPPCVRSIRS